VTLALGIFVIALWLVAAALGLHALVHVLRERRRHQRIARAHEPRPFRAQK
jgi:hypothetical protein